MKFEQYEKKYELSFRKGAYLKPSNLAIQIMCIEEGEDFEEPFSMLTVNLSDELPNGYAFIDTNNCPNGILMKLIEEGVATMTTLSAQSGFCTYPLVKFSEEWLNSLASM